MQKNMYTRSHTNMLTHTHTFSHRYNICTHRFRQVNNIRPRRASVFTYRLTGGSCASSWHGTLLWLLGLLLLFSSKEFDLANEIFFRTKLEQGRICLEGKRYGDYNLLRVNGIKQEVVVGTKKMAKKKLVASTRSYLWFLWDVCTRQFF